MFVPLNLHTIMEADVFSVVVVVVGVVVGVVAGVATCGGRVSVSCCRCWC